MICIGSCTVLNGCLEFAGGRHKEGLFKQNESGDMAAEVVNEMTWEPVTANEGDILVFDSYVPHRSAPNLTDTSRRVLFATYNKMADDDKRLDYYQEKRKYFPPEYERVAGVDYSLDNPFNLGNPIK